MVDGPRPPDDRALRASRAGCDARTARAELRARPRRDGPGASRGVSANADFRIEARKLRDQITSPARTVLLVLLAASALVFIIACSNVANLILARSVRREGELADSCRARGQRRRAATDAAGREPGALRRRRHPRRADRAADGRGPGALCRALLGARARCDGRRHALWVGVGLAVGAAVLLAFVPRLPSADAANGLGLSSGSVRITSGTNRRLRVFAVTQIAASFVLLAGAGMLLTTLIALQRTQTGFDMRNVLAMDVPVMSYERTPTGDPASTRRSCGGSPRCLASSAWRLARRAVARRRRFRSGLPVHRRGLRKVNGEEDPRARFRTVSPGFFAVAGRADHRRP